MKSPLAFGRLSIVAAFSLLLLIFAACNREAPPAAQKNERAATVAVDAAGIPINPTPPQDLSSRSADLTEVAQFAWQEFLALNWKSAVDPSGGTSPVGLRGKPDTTWSYSTPGAHPELLTWQTYAQTTELRPNGPLTIPFAQLGAPQYSYLNAVNAGSGNPSFTLWNNLDEDNEIGSCDIYAQYSSQQPPRNLVLFQVKVNSDEYEYLRTNFGADQDKCVNTSPAGQPPNCPPANQSPTGGALYQAQTAVIKNIANPPYEYFPGQPGGADATCGPCPPGLAICLPCGGTPNPAGGTYEGAIEVKSAWRKLLPADNPARFYTTNAIYYQVDANGNATYYNDTFALIGLHIIHKTKNFPDFVFATFEQVDVEQADMTYVLLKGATEQGPAVPIVRQTGQNNRTQNHPVPATLNAVTDQVHAQLTGLNKDIVWQYYRLTGVQAASVDCAPSPDTAIDPKTGKVIALPNAATQCPANQDPVACTNLDPNYFMANFVVESDPFLNNFSGPGFGANPFINCRNTVYANAIFDNGGCKGCHGVAQTSFGTDFSFLLDFGNNKPSVSPAGINNPSNNNLPGATTAAVRPGIKHYLDGVEIQPKRGDAPK